MASEQSGDGEQQETCKHCDEPATDGNETCLDCYVMAHAVNAGFPA